MPSDLEHLHHRVRRNPNDRTARFAYAEELERDGRILDAIRQRVIADPDNDDLRIRYADQIQEANPLVGEFIRVQAAGERNLGGYVDWLWSAIPTIRESYVPEGAELVEALEVGHLRVNWYWSMLAADVFSSEDRRRSFVTLFVVRGFIEEVRARWHDWTFFCADMLLHHPIRRLVLEDYPPRQFNTAETSDATYPSARLNSRWRYFPWRPIYELPTWDRNNTGHALLRDAFPSIERIELSGSG